MLSMIDVCNPGTIFVNTRTCLYQFKRFDVGCIADRNNAYNVHFNSDSSILYSSHYASLLRSFSPMLTPYGSRFCFLLHFCKDPARYTKSIGSITPQASCRLHCDTWNKTFRFGPRLRMRGIPPAGTVSIQLVRST